jgi:hypothetical protein
VKATNYLLAGYGLAIPGFILLWMWLQESTDVSFLSFLWNGGAAVVVGGGFLVLYRKEKDRDHVKAPRNPSITGFDVSASGDDHLTIAFDTRKWIRLMRVVFVIALAFGIAVGSVLFMFGSPPAFFMIIYIGLPLGLILISMLPIPKAVRCDRKAGTIQVVSCYALRGAERAKTLARAEVDRLEVEQVADNRGPAARLWILAVGGRRTFVYSSQNVADVQRLFDLVSRFMEITG